MSGYRPDFEAALRLFAQASLRMVEQGYGAPVLVGGGAVELYTASAVTTGDFDIVTPRQAEFEVVLQQLGFTKPGGLGHTFEGWIHPSLRLGFEVVSSTLLDGMADGDRVLLFNVGEAGPAAIISVEDIIADRMSQFASGTAPEMFAQAQALFQIHRDADLDYMDRRIRYETGGDYGVSELRA